MLSLEIAMPKSTSIHPLRDGNKKYNLKGNFIVLTGDKFFSTGTILKLSYNDKSTCPEFSPVDGGAAHYFLWSDLGIVHVKGGEQAGPLSDDPLVNPKKAAGAVKAPLHTLPTLAMIQMANVMAGGAYKYGFHNFRESKIDAQTYIGAINRHFLKWQDGVNFDEESGQHELAHVMACCAILIDAHFTDSLIDNRSKTGLVEGLLKTSQDTFDKFIKDQEANEA